MPPIGSAYASVVTLLNRRLTRAVDDSVDVRVQLPVRFMPRSEPQPDLALVRHRIVRHREPGRAGYGQRDEVTSGVLPLPTLGGKIGLAELF